MKTNNLDRLKSAVNTYKHDARTSKNPFKKEAYENIKKMYEGLMFFDENLNLSCGTLLPYLEINRKKIITTNL